MVRSSIALAALPAVVLAVTACGSAAPAHSAPAACRDFRKWFLAENGNVASGRNASPLETAVSEAPSGKLHRDLSTPKSNVSTTQRGPGQRPSRGREAHDPGKRPGSGAGLRGGQPRLSRLPSSQPTSARPRFPPESGLQSGHRRTAQQRG
jgi:hypothetical protein